MGNDTRPLLVLENVHKHYSGQGQAVRALRGISLRIGAGEFLAVTGPSGCGKSTLLNILGALDRATAGTCVFDGEDIGRYNAVQLAHLRGQRIGFVFQSFNLIDSLTVFENLDLGLAYRRSPVKNRRGRVLDAMDRVGIAHLAHQFPRRLSGGQQQRAAIARAIVGDPDLILADEPTGNLDSENADHILTILKSLNAEGAAVVMVTHALSQADQAERTIELLDGQIRMANRRIA